MNSPKKGLCCIVCEKRVPSGFGWYYKRYWYNDCKIFPFSKSGSIYCCTECEDIVINMLNSLMNGQKGRNKTKRCFVCLENIYPVRTTVEWHQFTIGDIDPSRIIQWDEPLNDAALICCFSCRKTAFSYLETELPTLIRKAIRPTQNQQPKKPKVLPLLVDGLRTEPRPPRKTKIEFIKEHHD